VAKKQSRLSFVKVSRATSRAAGSPAAFVIAVAALFGWLLSGPIFHFNDTWQLIVNTATTIVTFLMVFLIQGSQNRDTESLQVKVDELIRATPGADDALMDLEEADEKELKRIHAKIMAHARRIHAELQRRGLEPT
jgi:low affinity Fe/Cu permease